MQQTTVNLFRVKSCNALLTYATIYLKSSKIYFFPDTYPDTLYPIYVSKNVRIHRYFSRPKGARRKKCWETLFWVSYYWCRCNSDKSRGISMVSGKLQWFK
jgi:hypothetical protein